METEYLKEFIELARKLNFTTTARSLNIAQPTLSNHIHALEKELGVLLIERPKAGNPARLTAAGRVFLDCANDISHTVERSHRELEIYRRDPRDLKLVLKCPREAFIGPLMELVHGFRSEHPEVALVIRPYDESDSIDEIQRGSIDLASVGSTMPEADTQYATHGITTLAYAFDEVCLWVNENHPLATKETLVPSDLVGHRMAIPTNVQGNIWRTALSAFQRQFGLTLHVVEKASDSMEEFVILSVSDDELLCLDSLLARAPLFSMRPGWLVRTYTPSIRSDIKLAFRTNNQNPALALFSQYVGEHAKLEP